MTNYKISCQEKIDWYNELIEKFPLQANTFKECISRVEHDLQKYLQGKSVILYI